MTGDPRRDALEQLVRAFEVGIGEPVDDSVAGLTAKQVAADKAAILACFRRTMAPAPGAAVASRRGMRELWADAGRSSVTVLTFVVLVVLVVLFPTSGAALLLLFVAAPLGMVAKWSLEAHRDAELDRHGALLSERSVQFRRARRRLEGLIAGIDAGKDVASRSVPSLLTEKTSDFRASLAAARDALADMATRLSRGSRGAQEFVAQWAGDPERVVVQHQDAVNNLDPKEVSTALADLLARLHRLGPMAADMALAVEGSRQSVRHDASERFLLDEPTSDAISTELGEIYRDVALARGPIVKECTRLSRSFDTVHRNAVRHVLRTRTIGIGVRTASLFMVDAHNLSTLSPNTRTRRRSAYLSSMAKRRDISLVDVRRAVTAMRKVG